jgi:hypothetical protein
MCMLVHICLKSPRNWGMASNIKTIVHSMEHLPIEVFNTRYEGARTN